MDEDLRAQYLGLISIIDRSISLLEKLAAKDEFALWASKTLSDLQESRAAAEAKLRALEN